MLDDKKVFQKKIINCKLLENNTIKLKKSKCGKNSKKIEDSKLFLYYGILDGFLWSNQQFSENNVLISYDLINKYEEIPKPHQLDDHFFPDSLKNKIFKISEFKVKSEFKINNCKFVINIITELKDEDISTKLQELIYNIKWMMAWLYFASRLSRCIQNTNTLIIYFYKFENNKQFPNKQNEVITTKHANSAYSNVCNKYLSTLNMVIFRSDEWFKVFVHETFHAFNLSVPLNSYQFNNKMYEIFGLKIEYNLFETYAEFWARIINIGFKSFNNFKSDLTLFLTEFDKLIDIERTFSVIQFLKILKYNKIDYNNFYDDVIVYNHNYKEGTSIFSYYILTSLLLIGSSETIEWCFNNNKNIIDFKKTNENTLDFIDLINRILNLECSKEYINNIELWLNKNSNRDIRNSKCMRMSINVWI